jgi:hypothetical protein
MRALLVAMIAAQLQTAMLTAIVTDSAGNPVPGADVSIVGTSIHRSTDQTGRVTLGPLARGRANVRIRRLGFAELNGLVRLATASVEVRYKLVAVAADLNEVVVKASELKPDRYAGTTRYDAFYRRKAQGLGTFLTREIIDARNPQKSEDLLRMVTGVVIRYRGSTPFAQFLRCDHVNVYIDGIRSHDGFRDFFALSPLDIEAMEVYHGLATVPPEFSPEPNDCAAIVVWTRWR